MEETLRLILSLYRDNAMPVYNSKPTYEDVASFFQFLVEYFEGTPDEALVERIETWVAAGHMNEFMDMLFTVSNYDKSTILQKLRPNGSKSRSKSRSSRSRSPRPIRSRSVRRRTPVVVPPESPIAPASPGGSQVIGSGGYGCAVWPALVFWNSKTVTERNRKEYVTKIASDALEEYDTAKAIADLAPGCGIYPVDEPVCDLSLREMSKIKNSIECKNRFDPNLWWKDVGIAEIERLYKDLHKREYIHEWGIERHLPVRGGKFQSICAVQFPKFVSDLTRVFITDDMKTSLDDKLFTLHTNQVVHLDIKRQNLALLNGDVYFADWGFARILTTAKDVSEAAQFVLNYADYYGALSNKTPEQIEFLAQDALNGALPLSTRKSYLKTIDFLCLKNATGR
jgi:hypothetical protein